MLREDVGSPANSSSEALVRRTTKCLKYEKGIWWMPWRIEAMKDVLGCEKPGGAAKRL